MFSTIKKYGKKKVIIANAANNDLWSLEKNVNGHIATMYMTRRSIKNDYHFSIF